MFVLIRMKLKTNNKDR